MKKLRSLLLASVFGVLVATPAAADPVTAAVTAVSGFLASGTIAATIANFAIRAAASWGLSALANSLSPRQGQQQQPGIRTTATTAGGTQSQTIIFGRYATGGNAVCPPMTHGLKGEDTIDYLTYVIDLADYPISSLDRVLINKEPQSFTSPGNLYGNTAGGTRLNKKAWLRWYDGTQTAADDMLTQIYGAYERPWTADHILTGVPYAVLTFKFDQDILSSFPEVLFEVRGAPLYDPREDSSVGGEGPQRWNDPSTWAFTENPIVMVYNILRGLTLADGSMYGLGVPEDDLPLDRWAAQMNVCDELVAIPGIMVGGDTEQRYRCGLEFSTAQQPLDVIADILKSCGGQIAECGGIWNVSAGPVPFPRAHFADGTIITSSDRDLRPFRGLNDTYNAAHVSHPSRDAFWEATDAPPYYRPDLEAEDDGRRLVADLALPSVTYPYQAQRLAIEMVSDNRRMISHTLTLPPAAISLLPLDTITWTSAKNGYQAKLFEIASKTIDPKTLCVSVNLRERDPADYRYDYTDLTEPSTPGEQVEDGAPEGNAPEEGYTEPGTGNPLTPSRPGQSLGDLIALHDGSLSRSTDGASQWVKIPAPFSGAREISALDAAGYVVRDTSGGLWFSGDSQSWGAVDVLPATTDAGLLNGNFESGLDNWQTISGTPAALSTSTPAQRPGSAQYLAAEDAEVSQVVSVPAGKHLTLSGDALAGPGGVARIGIRAGQNESVRPFNQVAFDGANFRTDNGTSYRYKTVNNAFTMPDGTQVRIEWYAEAMTKYTAVNGSPPGLYGTSQEVQARLRFYNQATGAPVSVTGGFSIRNFDSGDGAWVQQAAGVSVLAGTGSNLPMTTSSADGYTWINARATAGTDNACSVLLESVHEFRMKLWLKDIESTSEMVQFIPDPLPEHNTITSQNDYGVSTSSSDWQGLSVSAQTNETQVEVYARGTGAAWMDNLRLTYSDDDGQARTLARDLRDRRHLAATSGALHVIANGDATLLASTPFAADLVAADGLTIVIASGTSVALSEDGGTTWSQHTATASVAQVTARERVLAVLTTGELVEVATGGLTALSAFGTEHRLAHDVRRAAWFAVEVGSGAMQESTDLVTWTAAPNMPAGGVSGYRLMPAEIGRQIGWRDGKPDLFWRDLSATQWSVSWSLLADIRDLTESK